VSIRVSEEHGRVPVTVFRVEGEVTEWESLPTRAREAFDAGTRNLLLDLSDVPYMASAGLRALHAIFTLLRTDAPSESDATMFKGIAAGTFKSPHLKLLRPSRQVLEVLNATGYDMFLEIHRDYNAALASF
jgi:hypothetical protein